MKKFKDLQKGDYIYFYNKNILKIDKNRVENVVFISNKEQNITYYSDHIDNILILKIRDSNLSTHPYIIYDYEYNEYYLDTSIEIFSDFSIVEDMIIKLENLIKHIKKIRPISYKINNILKD